MKVAGYRLRCTLPGHSKDVRCVSASREGNIITGSRDRTVKLWIPEGNGFVVAQTLAGHEGFVYAAIPVDATTVVTGCQDGKIRFYEGQTNPSLVLSGHTDTVCALAVSASGVLISGSWDKTAKIWENKNCTMTLSGHLAAVWAVAVVETGSQDLLTLTGSADKSIKLWKGNKSVKEFNGHTDCVRALAVINSEHFLSAANDATIRLWSLTSGECISTFYGHSSYIYSISLMPDGQGFVSCGEDRSVRLWKLENPSEQGQVIYLPAQSVWSVAVLDNSDIITGSSDGLVRVFTRFPERYAPVDVLETYEKELATTTMNAQQELGGVKVSDLPGPESLYEPGTREGQTKLVRHGESVACYSWSSATNEWTKIGDVLGAAGGTQSTSGKTLYEGKEYDFVFSIDIEEGKPPLKLPFNAGEDPWMAAQKFIHKHDLSQYYLDQIANFIVENTKGTQPNPSSSGGYADPFTGGNRYVPQGSNAPPQAAAAIDPFTGGGRYVPQGSSAAAQPVAGVDPFTGAGRYVPAGTEQASVAPTHFPQKTLMRFDQANIEAIINKLREFNSSKVTPDCQISEDDLASFAKLASEETCSENSLSPLPILLQWPPEFIFPVLDILRLALRKPQHCEAILKHAGAEHLILILTELARSNSAANAMLVLRILSHLCLHQKGKDLLFSKLDQVLQVAVNLVTNPTDSVKLNNQWKNVQIAAATLLVNLTVSMKENSLLSSIENKSQILSTMQLVLSVLTEDQAILRGLIALGTLLHQDEEAVALAQSLEFLSLVQKRAISSSPSGECAKQVAQLLK